MGMGRNQTKGRPRVQIHNRIRTELIYKKITQRVLDQLCPTTDKIGIRIIN